MNCMIDHYVFFATLQAEHEVKKREVLKSQIEAEGFTTSSSEVIENNRNQGAPADLNTGNKERKKKRRFNLSRLFFYN